MAIDYSKLFDTSSESFQAGMNLLESVGQEKSVVDFASMGALGEDETKFIAENKNVSTLLSNDDDLAAASAMIARAGKEGEDPEPIAAARKQVKDQKVAGDMNRFYTKPNAVDMLMQDPDFARQNFIGNMKGWRFNNLSANSKYDVKNFNLDTSDVDPTYNYSLTDKVNIARSVDEVAKSMTAFVDADMQYRSVEDITPSNTYVDSKGKEHMLVMTPDENSPTGWIVGTAGISTDVNPKDILSIYGGQSARGDGFLTTMGKTFADGVTSSTMRMIGSALENSFWKDEGIALQNKWYAGTEYGRTLEKDRVGLHGDGLFGYDLEGVMYSLSETMGAMIPTIVATAATGSAYAGGMLAGMAMGDGVNQEMREMGITDSAARKSMFWGMTVMGALTEGAIGSNRFAKLLYDKTGIVTGEARTEMRKVVSTAMSGIAKNAAEKNMARVASEQGMKAAFKEFGQTFSDFATKAIDSVGLKGLQEKIANNVAVKTYKSISDGVKSVVGAKVGTVLSNSMEEGQQEFGQYIGEVMIKNVYDMNTEYGEKKFNQGFSWREGIDNFMLGAVASVPFGLLLPADQKENLAKGSGLTQAALKFVEEAGGDLRAGRANAMKFISDQFGESYFQEMYQSQGFGLGDDVDQNHPLAGFKRSVDTANKLKQDISVVFDTLATTAKGNEFDLAAAGKRLGGDEKFLLDYSSKVFAFNELKTKVETSGKDITEEDKKAMDGYNSYFNAVENGQYRAAAKAVNYFADKGQKAYAGIYKPDEEVYKNDDTILNWYDSKREYNDIAQKMVERNSMQVDPKNFMTQNTTNITPEEKAVIGTDIYQKPYASEEIEKKSNSVSQQLAATKKLNQFEKEGREYKLPENKDKKFDEDSIAAFEEELKTATTSEDIANIATDNISKEIEVVDDPSDPDDPFIYGHDRVSKKFKLAKAAVIAKMLEEGKTEDDATALIDEKFDPRIPGMSGMVDSLYETATTAEKLTPEEKEEQLMHEAIANHNVPVSNALGGKHVHPETYLQEKLDTLINGEDVTQENLDKIAKAREQAVQLLKAQALNQEMLFDESIDELDKNDLHSLLNISNEDTSKNNDAIQQEHIKSLKNIISKANLILGHQNEDERIAQLKKYRKHYGRNLAIIAKELGADTAESNRIISLFENITDDATGEVAYDELYKHLTELGKLLHGDNKKLGDMISDLLAKTTEPKVEEFNSSNYKSFDGSSSYNYTLGDIDWESMSNKTKGSKRFNNIKELITQAVGIATALAENPEIVNHVKTTSGSNFELDLALPVGGISIEQINTLIAQTAVIQNALSDNAAVKQLRNKILNFQQLHGFMYVLFMNSGVDMKSGKTQIISTEDRNKLRSLEDLPKAKNIFLSEDFTIEDLYDEKFIDGLKDSTTANRYEYLQKTKLDITAFAEFLQSTGVFEKPKDNFYSSSFFAGLISSVYPSENRSTNQVTLNGNAGTGKTVIMMEGQLRHQAAVGGPLHGKKVYYIAPSQALADQAKETLLRLKNEIDINFDEKNVFLASDIKDIEKLPESALVIVDEFTLLYRSEMKSIQKSKAFKMLLGDPKQVSSNLFVERNNKNAKNKNTPAEDFVFFTGGNLNPGSFGYNVINMSQSFRAGLKSLTFLSNALRKGEVINGLESHSGVRPDTGKNDNKGVKVFVDELELVEEAAQTIKNVIESDGMYSIEDIAILVPSSQGVTIKTKTVKETPVDVANFYYDKIKSKVEALLGRKLEVAESNALLDRVMHFDRGNAEDAGGLIQGLSAYKVFAFGAGIHTNHRGGNNNIFTKLGEHGSDESKAMTRPDDVLVTMATRMKHDSGTLGKEEKDEPNRKYGYLAIGLSDAKNAFGGEYHENLKGANVPVDSFEKVKENKVQSKEGITKKAGNPIVPAQPQDDGKRNRRGRNKAARNIIAKKVERENAPLPIIKFDRYDDGSIKTIESEDGKQAFDIPKGLLIEIPESRQASSEIAENDLEYIDMTLKLKNKTGDEAEYFAYIQYNDDGQIYINYATDENVYEAVDIVTLPLTEFLDSLKTVEEETDEFPLEHLDEELYNPPPVPDAAAAVTAIEKLTNQGKGLFFFERRGTPWPWADMLDIYKGLVNNPADYTITFSNNSDGTVSAIVTSNNYSDAVVSTAKISKADAVKFKNVVGKSFSLEAANPFIGDYSINTAQDVSSQNEVDYQTFRNNLKGATITYSQEKHYGAIFTIAKINIGKKAEYKVVVQNRPTNNVFNKYKADRGNFNNNQYKKVGEFLFHLFRYNKKHEAFTTASKEETFYDKTKEIKGKRLFFNKIDTGLVVDKNNKVVFTRVKDIKVDALMKSVNETNIRYPLIINGGTGNSVGANMVASANIKFNVGPKSTSAADPLFNLVPKLHFSVPVASKSYRDNVDPSGEIEIKETADKEEVGESSAISNFSVRIINDEVNDSAFHDELLNYIKTKTDYDLTSEYTVKYNGHIYGVKFTDKGNGNGTIFLDYGYPTKQGNEILNEEALPFEIVTSTERNLDNYTPFENYKDFFQNVLGKFIDGVFGEGAFSNDLTSENGRKLYGLAVRGRIQLDAFEKDGKVMVHGTTPLHEMIHVFASLLNKNTYEAFYKSAANKFGYRYESGLADRALRERVAQEGAAYLSKGQVKSKVNRNASGDITSIEVDGTASLFDQIWYTILDAINYLLDHFRRDMTWRKDLYEVKYGYQSGAIQEKLALSDNSWDNPEWALKSEEGPDDNQLSNLNNDDASTSEDRELIKSEKGLNDDNMFNSIAINIVRKHLLSKPKYNPLRFTQQESTNAELLKKMCGERMSALAKSQSGKDEMIPHGDGSKYKYKIISNGTLEWYENVDGDYVEMNENQVDAAKLDFILTEKNVGDLIKLRVKNETNSAVNFVSINEIRKSKDNVKRLLQDDRKDYIDGVISMSRTKGHGFVHALASEALGGVNMQKFLSDKSVDKSGIKADNNLSNQTDATISVSERFGKFPSMFVSTLINRYNGRFVRYSHVEMVMQRIFSTIGVAANSEGDTTMKVLFNEIAIVADQVINMDLFTNDDIDKLAVFTNIARATENISNDETITTIERANDVLDSMLNKKEWQDFATVYNVMFNPNGITHYGLATNIAPLLSKIQKILVTGIRDGILDLESVESLAGNISAKLEAMKSKTTLDRNNLKDLMVNIDIARANIESLKATRQNNIRDTLAAVNDMIAKIDNYGAMVTTLVSTAQSQRKITISNSAVNSKSKKYKLSFFNSSGSGNKSKIIESYFNQVLTDRNNNVRLSLAEIFAQKGTDTATKPRWRYEISNGSITFFSANNEKVFTASVDSLNNFNVDVAGIDTNSGILKSFNNKRNDNFIWMAKALLPGVTMSKKISNTNRIISESDATDFERTVAKIAVLTIMNMRYTENPTLTDMDSFYEANESSNKEGSREEQIFKAEPIEFTYKEDESYTKVIPTGLRRKDIMDFANMIDTISEASSTHTKQTLAKGKRLLDYQRVATNVITNVKNFVDKLKNIDYASYAPARLSLFYNDPNFHLTEQRMDGGIKGNKPTDRRNLSPAEMTITHIEDFITHMMQTFHENSFVVPEDAQADRSNTKQLVVKNDIIELTSAAEGSKQIVINYENVVNKLKETFKIYDEMQKQSLLRLANALRSIENDANPKKKAYFTQQSRIEELQHAVNSTLLSNFDANSMMELMKRGAYQTDFIITNGKIGPRNAGVFYFGKDNETVVNKENRRILASAPDNLTKKQAMDIVQKIYGPALLNTNSQINDKRNTGKDGSEFEKAITKHIKDYNLEEADDNKMMLNGEIHVPTAIVAIEIAFNLTYLNYKPIIFGDPNIVYSAEEESKRSKMLSQPITVPAAIGESIGNGNDVYTKLIKEGAKVLHIAFNDISGFLPDFAFDDSAPFKQKVHDGTIFASPRMARFIHKSSGGSYSQADLYTMYKMGGAQTNMLLKGMTLSINPEGIERSPRELKTFKRMYNPNKMESGSAFHYFMDAYESYRSSGLDDMTAWHNATISTDIYIAENNLEVFDYVAPTESSKGKNIKFMAEDDFYGDGDIKGLGMSVDVSKMGINTAFNGSTDDGDISTGIMQQLLNIITGTIKNSGTMLKFLGIQGDEMNRLRKELTEVILPGKSTEDIVNGKFELSDLHEGLKVFAKRSKQGVRGLIGDYMNNPNFSMATIEKSKKIMQLLNKAITNVIKPSLAGTRTVDAIHIDSNIFQLSFNDADGAQLTESFVGEKAVKRFISKHNLKPGTYVVSGPRELLNSIPRPTDVALPELIKAIRLSEFAKGDNPIFSSDDIIASFIAAPNAWISTNIQDGTTKKSLYKLYGSAVKELAKTKGMVSYRNGEIISASNIAGKVHVPANQSMGDLFFANIDGKMVDLRKMTLDQFKMLETAGHTWFNNWMNFESDKNNTTEDYYNKFLSDVKKLDTARKVISVRTPSTNAHSGVVLNTIQFVVNSGLVTYYNPLDLYARGSDLDGDQSSLYHKINGNDDEKINGILVSSNNAYMDVLFDYYADSDHFAYIFKPINVDNIAAAAKKAVGKKVYRRGSISVNSELIKAAAEGEAIGIAAIVQKALTFMTQMTDSLKKNVFGERGEMVDADFLVKTLALTGDVTNVVLDNAKLVIAGLINMNKEFMPMINGALMDKDFLLKVEEAGIYKYDKAKTEYENRIIGLASFLTSTQMNDLGFSREKFHSKYAINDLDINKVVYNKMVSQRDKIAKEKRSSRKTTPFNDDKNIYLFEDGVPESYQTMLDKAKEKFNKDRNTEDIPLTKEEYEEATNDVAKKWLKTAEGKKLLSDVAAMPGNIHLTNKYGINKTNLINNIVESINKIEDKNNKEAGAYWATIKNQLNKIVEIVNKYNDIVKAKDSQEIRSLLKTFMANAMEAMENNESFDDILTKFIDDFSSAKMTKESYKDYKANKRDIKSIIDENKFGASPTMQAAFSILSSLSTNTSQDDIDFALNKLKNIDGAEDVIDKKTEINAKAKEVNRLKYDLKNKVILLSKIMDRNSHKFMNGLNMIYQYNAAGQSLLAFANIVNLNQFNFNDSYSLQNFYSRMLSDFGLNEEQLKFLFSRSKQEAEVLLSSEEGEYSFAERKAVVSKIRTQSKFAPQNRNEEFVVVKKTDGVETLGVENIVINPVEDIIGRADWLRMVSGHDSIWQMMQSFLSMSGFSKASMEKAPAIANGVKTFTDLMIRAGVKFLSRDMFADIEKTTNDYFYSLYLDNYINKNKDQINNLVNNYIEINPDGTVVVDNTKRNTSIPEGSKIDLNTAEGRFMFQSIGADYIMSLITKYKAIRENNDILNDNAFLRDVSIKYGDGKRVLVLKDVESQSQDEFDYQAGIEQLPENLKKIIATYMLVDSGLGYNYTISRYMPKFLMEDADAFILNESMKGDHNEGVYQFLVDAAAANPEKFFYVSKEVDSGINAVNTSITTGQYDTFLYEADGTGVKYYKLPFGGYGMTKVAGKINRIEVNFSGDEASKKQFLYPVMDQNLVSNHAKSKVGSVLSVNGISDSMALIYNKDNKLIFPDKTEAIVVGVKTKDGYNSLEYKITKRGDMYLADTKVPSKSKKVIPKNAFEANMAASGITDQINGWISAARKMFPGLKVNIMTSAEARGKVEGMNPDTKSFVYNGEVYILSDKVTTDVTIHELFGHILNGHIKASEPALWKQMIEMAKSSSLFERIMNDENYQDLIDPNDPDVTAENIADEALSQSMQTVFANDTALQNALPVRNGFWEIAKGYFMDAFYKFFPKSLNKAIKDIGPDTNLLDFSEKVIRLAASGQYVIDGGHSTFTTFLNQQINGFIKRSMSAINHLNYIKDVNFSDIKKLFVSENTAISKDREMENKLRNIELYVSDITNYENGEYRNKYTDELVQVKRVKIRIGGRERVFNIDKVGDLSADGRTVTMNKEFKDEMESLIQEDIDFNANMQDQFFNFLKELNANDIIVSDVRNTENISEEFRRDAVIDRVYDLFFRNHGSHLVSKYEVNLDEEGNEVELSEFMKSHLNELKQRVYEQVRRTLFAIDYDPTYDKIYIEREASELIDADPSLMDGLIVVVKRGLNPTAPSQPVVINRLTKNKLGSSVNDVTPSIAGFIEQAERIRKGITLDNSEGDLGMALTAIAIAQHNSKGVKPPLLVKTIRSISLSRSAGLNLNKEGIASQVGIRSDSPENLMKQMREIFQSDVLDKAVDPAVLAILRDGKNFSADKFADTAISALDEVEAMMETLDMILKPEEIKEYLDEIRGFRNEYMGMHNGPSAKESFIISINNIARSIRSRYGNNEHLANMDERLMTLNKLRTEIYQRERQIGSLSEGNLNSISNSLLQVQELSGDISKHFMKAFFSVETTVTNQLRPLANAVDDAMKEFHDVFGTSAASKLISRSAAFKHFASMERKIFARINFPVNADGTITFPEWDSMESSRSYTDQTKNGETRSVEERIDKNGITYKKVNHGNKLYFEKSVSSGQFHWDINSKATKDAIAAGEIDVDPIKAVEKVKALGKLIDLLDKSIIENVITSTSWKTRVRVNPDKSMNIRTHADMEASAISFLKGNGYEKGMIPFMHEDVIEGWVKNGIEEEGESWYKKAWKGVKRLFSNTEVQARKESDHMGVNEQDDKAFSIQTRVFKEFNTPAGKDVLSSFYLQKGLLYNSETGLYEIQDEDKNKRGSIDLYNIINFSNYTALQNRAVNDLFLPVKDHVQEMLKHKMAVGEGGQYEKWNKAMEDLWDMLVLKKEGNMGDIELAGWKLNFTTMLNIGKSLQTLNLFGFNFYQYPKSLYTNTMELIYLAMENKALNRERMFNEKHLIKAIETLASSEGQTKATALNNAYGIVQGTPEAIISAYQHRPEFKTIISKDLPMIFLMAPDLWQRNVFMVAQMMAMGTWDAHSVNGSGDVIYDETKDRQYYSEDGKLSEAGTILRNNRIMKRKDEGLQLDHDRLTGAFDSTGVAFLRTIMNMKIGSGEKGASTPLFSANDFGSLFTSISSALIPRMKSTVTGWTGDTIGALDYSYIGDDGKLTKYSFSSESMLKSFAGIIYEMQQMYKNDGIISPIVAYHRLSPEAKMKTNNIISKTVLFTVLGAVTTAITMSLFGDDDDDELTAIKLGTKDSTWANEAQLKARKRISNTLMNSLWETHYHVDPLSIAEGWIEYPTTSLIYSKKMLENWQTLTTFGLREMPPMKKDKRLLPVNSPAFDFFTHTDYEAIQEQKKETRAETKAKKQEELINEEN